VERFFCACNIPNGPLPFTMTQKDVPKPYIKTPHAFVRLSLRSEGQKPPVFRLWRGKLPLHNWQAIKGGSSLNVYSHSNTPKMIFVTAG
jgi:hypothetical protein